MNKQFITITFLLCLCIYSVYTKDTVKYASGCSVDLCTLKTVEDDNNNGTNSTGGCPDLPLCYSFDTSLNTSICGPQVACSLFEPCTSAKKCATNTSVCILNTCCASPICMPIALTSTCSRYTPNSRTYWSGTICSNATWDQNGTLLISNYLGNNYWASFSDFVIDSSNNFFINEPGNYRVLKISPKNTSTYTVVAITNVTENYQATNIFLDKNGALFTAESVWSSYAMQTLYRIMKYTTKNGVINGTVVYGPTTCGTNTSNLCGAGGFFVDRLGAIYYSDSSNYRVLKITPFASSATVIAGISGVYGSSANQLQNPGSIFVDSSGSLYVADQSNYRIMKFTAGNLLGAFLYNLPTYSTPNSILLDNAGSVYFAVGNVLYKYIPSLGTAIQVISQLMYGYGSNSVRMDSNGNFYSNGNGNYMNYGIYKYNLTANYC